MNRCPPWCRIHCTRRSNRSSPPSADHRADGYRCRPSLPHVSLRQGADRPRRSSSTSNSRSSAPRRGAQDKQIDELRQALAGRLSEVTEEEATAVRRRYGLSLVPQASVHRIARWLVRSERLSRASNEHALTVLRPGSCVVRLPPAPIHDFNHGCSMARPDEGGAWRRFPPPGLDPVWRTSEIRGSSRKESQ